MSKQKSLQVKTKSLPAKKIFLLRWIVMAAIDVILVSLIYPLSFYAGMLYSQSGYCLKLWGIMAIIVFCNAFSLIAGYCISWWIFNKD
jgi:hypothetical protein